MIQSIALQCAALPPYGPLYEIGCALVDLHRNPSMDMTVMAGISMPLWQAEIAKLRLQDLARSHIRV